MGKGPCVVLHLRLRCDPKDRDQLLSFMHEAVPFYEEPGGIRIRLLEDMTDPSRFIEIVEYETEEAYERDRPRVESDGRMQVYLRRWRSLLNGPVELETYKEVNLDIGKGRE
jgi:quinol monooxygenase YgiN